MVSSLAAAVSLAKIDAFYGKVRSTTSSGRSEAGKNCRGTSGRAKSDATKHASVIATVIQRWRMAVSSSARNVPMMRLGFSSFLLSGALSSQTPRRGANSTATNQETISAIDTTAKIENVYSPAEDRAKPIGTKPAAVTNEPVSIGNASVS